MTAWSGLDSGAETLILDQVSLSVQSYQNQLIYTRCLPHYSADNEQHLADEGYGTNWDTGGGSDTHQHASD